SQLIFPHELCRLEQQMRRSVVHRTQRSDRKLTPDSLRREQTGTTKRNFYLIRGGVERNYFTNFHVVGCFSIKQSLGKTINNRPKYAELILRSYLNPFQPRLCRFFRTVDPKCACCRYFIIL